MTSYNKRIIAIATYIDKAEEMIDIGTDHAYLPIYCIENNIVKRAVVTDLNEGPLLAAKNNILYHGLSENIKTVRCDGFDLIEVGKNSVAVIAGMGGEIITGILEKAGRKLNNGCTLVLQPMTSHEYLKKYLLRNGFDIKKESCFIFRERPYVIIKGSFCDPGKDPDDFDVSLFVPEKFPEDEKEAVKKFIYKVIIRQRNVLKGYSAQNNKMLDKQIRLVEEIEKYYESI